MLANETGRVPFIVDPSGACITWLKIFLSKVSQTGVGGDRGRAVSVMASAPGLVKNINRRVVSEWPLPPPPPIDPVRRIPARLKLPHSRGIVSQAGSRL